MAITAVFEFPGEPVEKYRKVFDAGQAIVNQPDRLYHVCYRTGTGFTVIDIWADEQSIWADNSPSPPSARSSARPCTTLASTQSPPSTQSSRS